MWAHLFPVNKKRFILSKTKKEKNAVKRSTYIEVLMNWTVSTSFNEVHNFIFKREIKKRHKQINSEYFAMTIYLPFVYRIAPFPIHHWIFSIVKFVAMESMTWFSISNGKNLEICNENDTQNVREQHKWNANECFEKMRQQCTLHFTFLAPKNNDTDEIVKEKRKSFRMKQINLHYIYVFYASCIRTLWMSNFQWK